MGEISFYSLLLSGSLSSLACMGVDIGPLSLMFPSMTTPVHQRYLSIKKQFPDLIVFFRLGDLYETFDDDHEMASIRVPVSASFSEPVLFSMRRA